MTLKALRESKNLTQEVLARRAVGSDGEPLSLSTVRNIEAGRVPDPRYGTLEALAAVLDVGVEDLAAAVRESVEAAAA